MSKLRPRLTYANVMVTILAFVMFAGGAAYAGSRLSKNSVGPKQLRKGSVTSAKVKRGAITAAKVKADSLGPAQIDESRLGKVPSAVHADSADVAASAATFGGATPGAFFASDRVLFGTGNAVSTSPQTVLALPELGVTVSTDGDVDTTPEVVVNLPSSSYWLFFDENSGTQMFSLPSGGKLTLNAQPEVANVRSSYASALIWRVKSTGSATESGIYLRCVFDTHGFTSARPLACWALQV